MPELEPCPFCRNADLVDDFTSGGYKWMHVRCRCGALGPGAPMTWRHEEDRKAAREAWNRRSIERELSAVQPVGRSSDEQERASLRAQFGPSVATLIEVGSSDEGLRGWPEGVQIGDLVRVSSDDEPERWMQVLVANDGDVHVSIPAFDTTLPHVRVCTKQGGGRNHHTRIALLHLVRAMKLDAAENPRAALSTEQRTEQKGEDDAKDV